MEDRMQIVRGKLHALKEEITFLLQSQKKTNRQLQNINETITEFTDPIVVIDNKIKKVELNIILLQEINNFDINVNTEANTDTNTDANTNTNTDT
jgi:septal ring factor EnvC (AmiA/AmiB activator)